MSDVSATTSGVRAPYPPQDDERIHVFVVLPDGSGYQVTYGRWYSRADAEIFKAAVEADGSGRRVLINPANIWDNTVCWTADDTLIQRRLAVSL